MPDIKSCIVEIAGETLSSYLKYDTAICLVLYLCRQLAFQGFDFDEIYIPDNRANFDLKIASNFTNARIIQHKGPMQAKFSVSLVTAKNDSYEKNIAKKLKKKSMIYYHHFSHSYHFQSLH